MRSHLKARGDSLLASSRSDETDGLRCGDGCVTAIARTLMAPGVTAIARRTLTSGPVRPRQ